MSEVNDTEDVPSADVLAAVFAHRSDLAVRYVRSLAAEGVLRGLIGPRESGRLWTRHVLNSAVVAELIAPGASVVDIGSGAGLPGIPLAIARPDCTVILVEPLLRRTVYLAEIVAELGLTNCRVLRGRAEDVIGRLGAGATEGADVVTSRAVAPLAKLARWSVPLLRVGGQFLPLKGASAADEVARDTAELAALGLGPAEVLDVGDGVVDPPTHVVRAELLRRVPGSVPGKAGGKGVVPKSVGRKRAG
ncbi:16S rRNA (guanine(527)-N(7))-methyltransferase RsmG [Nakamurella lactea]|uniref:16S rRNA (guanine(527)-N(7))-methyltransferase RsmG n=1 Tax=Nakamurella lactea TaxID=459515 RepID=UPI00040D842E|nr:16S rRNA (guanine(527)-N(7))-methyltransferase RsmG [Nakamurella lactea]